MVAAFGWKSEGAAQGWRKTLLAELSRGGSVCFLLLYNKALETG
jgi:hypothetical protein